MSEETDDVNIALAYFHRTRMHELSETHGHGFIEELSALIEAAEETSFWIQRFNNEVNTHAEVMRDNARLRGEISDLKAAISPHQALLERMAGALRQTLGWMVPESEDYLYVVEVLQDYDNGGVRSDAEKNASNLRTRIKELENENAETHARIWQLQERLREEMERK